MILNFLESCFTAEITIDPYGTNSDKISGLTLEKKVTGRGFAIKRAIMGDSPIFPPNVMYPDSQYDKIVKVGKNFSFLLLKKVF